MRHIPHSYAPRSRTLLPANAVGSQALAAMAVGALAVGAVALGALAIGRLAVGRAKFKHLEIDELVVYRLRLPSSEERR